MKLKSYILLFLIINFIVTFTNFSGSKPKLCTINPISLKISDLQQSWNVREVWNQTWDGGGNDEGCGVVTINNTIFLAGNTNSMGAGYYDAFLFSHNETGSRLWNQTWGGNYDEFVNAITANNDNIYLAGNTYSFGAGLFDAFLIKFNLSGFQLWNRTWGTNENDFGAKIAIDGSTIYFVGTTNNTGNYNVFLVKYDDFGNQIWNRTWGGAKKDIGNGIAIFGNKIYLTGYTESFGTGGKEMFLVKYDTSGAYIWNRTWGGADDESGRDITIYENNIYITGYTYSFGGGLCDIFLNKYDFEGNLIINQVWGEYWDERGISLIVHNKKIYIAGETYSFGEGSYDILLLVYNIDGTQSYYKTWGTPDSEYGNDIIIYNDSIYIVGTMKNFSAGNENACLIKFRETMTSISSPFPIFILVILQIQENPFYSNILIAFLVPILIIIVIAAVAVVVGTLLYLRYKKKPSKKTISTITSSKQILLEVPNSSNDEIEIKKIVKDNTDSKIQESIEKGEPSIKKEKILVKENSKKTEIKKSEAISEKEIQYIQSLEKERLIEIISNFEEDFMNYLSPAHPLLFEIRLWKKDIIDNTLPKLTYNTARRLIIDIKKWEKEF